MTESLRKAVVAAFTPTVATIRVGLELERFPVDSQTGRPVPVERVKAALGPLTSVVTFEPGGQVELSPRCQRSLTTLLETTARASARVDHACALHGIELVAGGVHPTATPDEIGLQITSPRYESMQRHFDRIGPAGRQMMRATAALQVCVDLLPGTVAKQWTAAVAVAPVLAAIFGRGADPTARTRVWGAVDQTRTAFDGRLLAADPVEAYLSFAAGATHVPPRPDRGCPETKGSIARDVAHHLSTLFPPVRPRGYLEIRCIDSQPPVLVAPAVVLTAALLCDRVAVGDVIDVLGRDRDDLVERWRIAAAEGVGSSRLRRDALDVVAIARASVERLAHLDPPADALDVIDGLVSDRCYSVASSSERAQKTRTVQSA